jgi:hypothetical protein
MLYQEHRALLLLETGETSGNSTLFNSRLKYNSKPDNQEISMPLGLCPGTLVRALTDDDIISLTTRKFERRY